MAQIEWARNSKGSPPFTDERLAEIKRLMYGGTVELQFDNADDDTPTDELLED